MAKLVQKAEILTSRPYSDSSTYIPTTPSIGAIKIYKSSFDALIGIHFEAVFSVTFTGIPDGGGTGRVQLYNLTQSAAVSGSEVTGSTISTTYFRIRSSNLIDQINDGDVVYPQYKGASGTVTTALRSAKIIFIQKGKITKTVTYIQIGDDVLNSSGLQSEVTRRKRWAHTAGNYDSSVTYSFDCTCSSFGGATATFRLRDITAGAERASVNTTSTTDVYLTATPSALTDGNELSTTVQTATPITDGAQQRNAFFIIFQSGTVQITKLITTIQVWSSEVTTTSTTYATGEFKEAGFTPTDYIDCSIDTLHEASIKISNAASTASAIIKDDAVEITGSEVSTSATAYTRVQSGALTEPTLDSDIDFDLKTSNGSHTASLCSSRLVITITNLRARNRMLPSMGVGY